MFLFFYVDDEGYNFGGEYLFIIKEVECVVEMVGFKYVIVFGFFDDWFNL